MRKRSGRCPECVQGFQAAQGTILFPQWCLDASQHANSDKTLAKLRQCWMCDADFLCFHICKSSCRLLPMVFVVSVYSMGFIEACIGGHVVLAEGHNFIDQHIKCTKCAEESCGGVAMVMGA